MSIAEVKNEISRMTPREIDEIVRFARVHRVMNDPAALARIDAAAARLEAGHFYTQEQVEALVADRLRTRE